MHEVSIALAMADELMKLARENNAGKVTAVRLKIGKVSGIVSDSLKFAFDAVKLEHPVLAETVISIEETPLIYECGDCGRTFGADNAYFPSCPGCASYSLKLISGEEQHIENVELEV